MLRRRASACPVHRVVAQLAEHRSPKPGVAGSSPAGPVRVRAPGRRDLQVIRGFLVGRTIADGGVLRAIERQSGATWGATCCASGTWSTTRPSLPSRARPANARAHREADRGRSAPSFEALSFGPKWDGVRALLLGRDGAVDFRSRHGTDITERFPELAGLADVASTTSCSTASSSSSAAKAPRPLTASATASSTLAPPPSTPRGRRPLRVAVEWRIEGLVAKRLTSTYEPGRPARLAEDEVAMGSGRRRVQAHSRQRAVERCGVSQRRSARPSIFTTARPALSVPIASRPLSGRRYARGLCGCRSASVR